MDYRITLSGEAPAYRLTIPATLYGKIDQGKPHTLQVFNARGEPVPTQRVPLAVTWERRHQRLPFYDLPAGQTGTKQDARTNSGVILDGGPLGGAPWQSVELDLAETAYRGRVRWWFSDDLRQWHDGGESSLLKLEGGPAQTRLDLDARSGRYLRIDWLDQPFTLNNAQGTALRARPAAPHWQWSPWVTARPGRAAGDYEFDLGVHAPLERLQIRLPQSNTVVATRWLARDHASADWQPVWQQNLVHLDNAPLTLSGFAATPLRYWRLSADTSQGGLGSGMPSVRAAWQAQQLRFVARGPAPFTLSYRPAHAQTRSGPVSGVKTAMAGLEKPSVPESKARTPAEPGLARTLALWGSLMLAVMLLLVMAWRLIRSPEPDTPATAPPEQGGSGT
ncbi:DUF3999 family protein [Chitinibacteraceae bacterium HSL-7]